MNVGERSERSYSVMYPESSGLLGDVGMKDELLHAFFLTWEVLEEMVEVLEEMGMLRDSF